MNLTAIIVDDEVQARSALKYEIRANLPNIDIVGEAGDVKNAIDEIKKLRPNIVFLDIQLTDGLGFEVIEAIKDVPIKLIFTTAYSQYALKAIKFSAIDYLLKPISASDLKSAVQRVYDNTPEDTVASLRAYIHNAVSDSAKKKVAIYTSEGVSLVQIYDIVYCSSEGNYTKFYFRDNTTLLTAKTLKEYEELLTSTGFIRIHLSYLINIDHVISYNNREGGSVTLTGDIKVPVAQRKRSSFLKVLGAYNERT